MSQKMFWKKVSLRMRFPGQCGTRALDHKVKGLALYRLSYAKSCQNWVFWQNLSQKLKKNDQNLHHHVQNNAKLQAKPNKHGASWLLPGCFLAPSWLLPGCFLAASLAPSWLLPGSFLAPSWLLPGCFLAASLAPSWLLPGSWLVCLAYVVGDVSLSLWSFLVLPGSWLLWNLTKPKLT